jgi:hypothetical protein
MVRLEKEKHFSSENCSAFSTLTKISVQSKKMSTTVLTRKPGMNKKMSTTVHTRKPGVNPGACTILLSYYIF